jgi:hypothetical protein
MRPALIDKTLRQNKLRLFLERQFLSKNSGSAQPAAALTDPFYPAANSEN